MIKIRRFMRYLERPEIVRIQVLAYICIFSIHARLREHYLKHYGAEVRNVGDQKKGELQNFSMAENSPIKSNSSNQTSRLMPNIKWRDFPKAPKMFVLFRAFTTAWMIYILIRYSLSDYIGAKLSKFIVLRLPIHCYLVGRFIINRKLAEVTAVIFSGPHLVWRLANSLVDPYYSGVVYFMLLDEHDLELVYSRLGAYDRSFKLEPGVEERLSLRERLLIDTMCYRVRHPTRVLLRLRANRTREIHLVLRRKIATLTLIVSGLFVPIAVILTLGFLIMNLNDFRYLDVYPGCDPEMQERRDKGLIGLWTVTFVTSHRWFVALGDVLENLAVWVENGFVATLAAAVPFLLNYDLFLHWKSIDEQINRLANWHEYKEWQPINSRKLSRTSIIRRSNPLKSNIIAALILEMDDFFKQYKKASDLLSLCLDGSLICILIMCSAYTYFTRIKGITSLPLDVVAVLFFLSTSITIGCISFLMVHWSCMKSYSKLCSLMANDNEKHKHNYGTIMEYLATQRTCVKLLKHYPFLPTTFLTIIGWTFSCFFIISELLERSVFYGGKFLIIPIKSPT